MSVKMTAEVGGPSVATRPSPTLHLHPLRRLALCALRLRGSYLTPSLALRVR